MYVCVKAEAEERIKSFQYNSLEIITRFSIESPYLSEKGFLQISLIQKSE